MRFLITVIAVFLLANRENDDTNCCDYDLQSEKLKETFTELYKYEEDDCHTYGFYYKGESPEKCTECITYNQFKCECSVIEWFRGYADAAEEIKKEEAPIFEILDVDFNTLFYKVSSNNGRKSWVKCEKVEDDLHTLEFTSFKETPSEEWVTYVQNTFFSEETDDSEDVQFGDGLDFNQRVCAFFKSLF